MTCLVVGAGAQGRVVLETWRAQRPADRFAFLDDSVAPGTVILGAEVLGPVSLSSKLDGEVVLALGNNRRRLELAARLAVRWGTVVHPSAVVMPSAALGPGTVVFAGSVVGTEARVGAHVVVNSGVILEHDGIVEDGASLSPGVRSGGRVHVAEGAFVATGVTLAPRSRVGAWSIVGAGAVVVRDVPDNAVAYGVPARVVGSADGFDWKRVL